MSKKLFFIARIPDTGSFFAKIMQKNYFKI